MRVGLLIGLALVASCSPWNTSEQQAVEAASAYLDAKSLTKFGDGRRVAVRDEEAQWAVVYRTPEDSAGGDFIVFVEKGTMKAVNHVGYQ
jgi:hypothetical protein